MQTRNVAFCVVVLIAASLCACKKKTTDGVTGEQPLYPASTGWERIGKVPYTYTNMGLANYNSMQPYELMLVNGQMEILYSENSKLSGTDARAMYKGIFTPAGDAVATSIKLPIKAGGNQDNYQGYYYPHFLPGTFAAVTLKYYANPSPNGYVAVTDENGTDKSSHFIGHAGGQGQVYSNGDMLDGAIGYSGFPTLEFYAANTNSWTFINSTTYDTTAISGYMPFRLTDGAALTCNVTYKNERVYLSIADPVPTATFGTPFYHSRFLEEVPGLSVTTEFTNYPKILCSCTDGNTLTIVVGSYPYNSPKIDRLSAFKWTAGSSSFTTVYSNIDISGDLRDYLNTGNGKCNAAGTAYAWLSDPNAGTTSLYTISSGGVTKRGMVTNNGYTQIGCVQYINDAFYAVAYPLNDYADSSHTLRMEVLRLK